MFPMFVRLECDFAHATQDLSYIYVDMILNMILWLFASVSLSKCQC